MRRVLHQQKSPDSVRERFVRLVCFSAALTLLSLPVASLGTQTYELGGYAGVELRVFREAPADVFQMHHSGSILARPELRAHWDSGRQAVVFSPFFRWDAVDGERTHWDLREFYWERWGEGWNLRVGVDRVFWGVMESQHLVDFINQTDLVENLDAEEKLGQPMVNLNFRTDLGAFELFILPGFRERTFPGQRGRLRTQPFVDTGEASYSSSRGRSHVDFAARWSAVFGKWDLSRPHAIARYRLARSSRVTTAL